MNKQEKPEDSSKNKTCVKTLSAFGKCGELKVLFYDYEPEHFLTRRNFIVQGYFILFAFDKVCFLKAKFQVKEFGVSNPNLTPELMICYN